MLGWWKNVLTYPVAKDKQNRKDSVDSSEPSFTREMKQIVLTQVKIVLTLPNLVYKGNETNSVNSGQNSVNSSEPSLQGK